MLQDPFEENNLAAANPEILQQLTKKYEAWSVSVNQDLSKVMAKYYPPGSKQARREKKQKETHK